ncbi:MAG: hypothetical protein GF375_00005, partial [Candidatus Omnitrophica bacterium]|nr:hypothetical protein [Candidatus Omnitrophota bacterium]MBD3268551.1 hypothetical protein [Candidatus Omnitrophota bacterium]
HMGSAACQSASLMKKVMREIKKRDLIFIDSRTSPDSVAYEIAKKEGLLCSYNEGFIDSPETRVKMRERFDDLIAAAKKKGKIVAIAHPKGETIAFLREQIKRRRKELEFITIKDYFNLDDFPQPNE